MSDEITGTVYQLADHGTVLSTPTVVTSGLVDPEGISVSADGRALLIVEVVTKRLLRFHLATHATKVLATNLPIGQEPYAGGPPFSFAITTATEGQFGIIYFGGDLTVSLYRLVPNLL